MADSPDASERLGRAKAIYLSARVLGLAEREEFIRRECAGDDLLRGLVHELLAAEGLPLPFETLADDIRAAKDQSPTASLSADRGTMPPGGDRIGNYRLLQRLGEGGFGVVFMAEQEKPVRRRVALKIIKLGMDTKQVVARFEAERQALALMDHPNIAKVFDAGATETGRPYFVMELVRGLPITAYCDQKKLGIRERLALVAQVCEALQHSHQRGVIHRDIKPSNVLVSTIDGDRPLPKIIDFGIAKAVSARLTERTIFTEFRQLIGTPEYMSPEQAGEANHDIDTRTDVYAAGVLLYELLTGATPFDAVRLRSAAYGEVQRIIREEDPPKPSTRVATKPGTLAAAARQRSLPPARLASSIRGELDWIVMKAIEKDRARRYDSAGSMGADIQRYLSGHAVLAAPPGRAYLIRKFVRRNKGPVIATSTLAVALVAGLLGTSLGFFNAERQRKVAVSAKERADENAAKALAAEATAQRNAYSAGMLSACSAMSTKQFGAAKAFLEATPESLRGWEWRTLWSRLDTSVREIACPLPGWRPDEPSGANALIAHPDGRSFFTVRRDEADAAQRWDVATGSLLSRYARPVASPPREGSRSMFQISSDGTRLLAYAGGNHSTDCGVGVWDLRTDEQVMRAEPPPAGDSHGVVGMSPDGARLVRNLGAALTMQDIANGETLATGQIEDMVRECVFSPDGALIAAPSPRGNIGLLDGHTLAPVATLVGHTNDIQGLDFSRDGRWLASGAIDGRSIVWDLKASPPTSVVFRHPSTVGGIRLSPDASLVATSCTDSTIRVWDALTGELIASFTKGGLLRGAVMFMADGRTVAGRERDGTVRFWDVHAETTVNLRGHKGLLNQVFFADGAGLIVSSGWDGWKGSTGCIRFSDAQTGEEVAAFGEPGELVHQIAVSGDGLRAAADILWTPSPWTPSAMNHLLRTELIDLTTGRRVRIAEERLEDGQSHSTTPLAFDSTGRFLAIEESNVLKILDARTGEALRAGTTPRPGRRHRVLWSPDGRFLVSFRFSDTVYDSATKIIEIIDASTLETIRRFDDFESSRAAAITPDSAYLYTGDDTGLMRRYSLASGKIDLTLQAHDLAVMSISFNSDGSRIATAGGHDGDIVVWDTTSEPFQRVAVFHEDGYVNDARWDASGERLLGACDQLVRVWDPTPLRERVDAREARKLAVSKTEPLVATMFEQFEHASAVAERIRADQSLSPLERRTALQVVLRRGLEAPAALSPERSEPAAGPR